VPASDGREEEMDMSAPASTVDRMLRSYTDMLNGSAKGIGGMGSAKDDVERDVMRVGRASAFSGSIPNPFCSLCSRSWMCVRGSGPSPQGWVKSRRRPRPSM
jgi:hypothetical protein